MSSRFYEDSSDDFIDDQSLSQRITSVVDDILGARVGETEKKKFLNSLLGIARKQTIDREDIDHEPRDYFNQNYSIPSGMSMSNPSTINIFLMDDPMNPCFPQDYPMQNYNPYYNGQPQPIQQPLQTPYPMQQIPQPMQQIPQPMQQPNFLFGPPPNQSITKKHHHHHHKKSHKKSKKDKKKKEKKEEEEGDFKIDTFEYDGQNRFNGIMRHLNDQVHTNIHDKGIIEITCNSSEGPSGSAKNLVSYDNEQCYRSSRSELATITFDFKDRSIQPTSYLIKSCGTGISSRGPFLRNWVIEVSNDNKKWTEIDSHQDDAQLRKSLVFVNFNIKDKQKKFYRYIRLRQTGPSWDKDGSENHIILRGIDFYGKLKSPSE